MYTENCHRKLLSLAITSKGKATQQPIIDALPLDITTPELVPLPTVAQALLFGAPMPA
jgi:hypothetical protein